jgi:hypothetical protein
MQAQFVDSPLQLQFITPLAHSWTPPFKSACAVNIEGGWMLSTEHAARAPSPNRNARAILLIPDTRIDIDLLLFYLWPLYAAKLVPTKF